MPVTADRKSDKWRIGVENPIDRDTWADRRDCILSRTHGEDVAQITFRRPALPPKAVEIKELTERPLIDLCHKVNMDLPERKTLMAAKQRVAEAEQMLAMLGARHQEIEIAANDPKLLEDPECGSKLISYDAQLHAFASRMSEQRQQIERLRQAVSTAEVALRTRLNDLARELVHRVRLDLFAQRERLIARLAQLAEGTLTELLTVDAAWVTASALEKQVPLAARELFQLQDAATMP